MLRLRYICFALPILSGLITSACLPVVFQGNTVGVTCADISLDLVLNDVSSFKLGQFSYAFAVDGHGRALLHPLLPLSRQYVQVSNPVIVDIGLLETSPGSDVIRASMMRYAFY